MTEITPVRQKELLIAQILGYQVNNEGNPDNGDGFRLSSPWSCKKYPLRRAEQRAWNDVPRYCRSEASVLPMLREYGEVNTGFFAWSIDHNHRGFACSFHWMRDGHKVHRDDNPFNDSRNACLNRYGITIGDSVANAIILLEAIRGAVSRETAEQHIKANDVSRYLKEQETWKELNNA